MGDVGTPLFIGDRASSKCEAFREAVVRKSKSLSVGDKA